MLDNLVHREDYIEERKVGRSGSSSEKYYCKYHSCTPNDDHVSLHDLEWTSGYAHIHSGNVVDILDLEQYLV